MREFVVAVARSTRDELAKEIGKKLAVGLMALLCAGAIWMWAYLGGVRPPVIAMFLYVGVPTVIASLLAIWIMLRHLTSNRAELAIEYDPNVNLLPMGNNSSDVRLFIRNKSAKHPARNLRVKIERLVPVGATTADPQAGQFNNVRMKLERFKHGEDDLPAHENVEIMGPVTYASNKQFFFRSDEPEATQGRYHCKPGTYRMTVFAVADNADPMLAAFIVSEKNGALHMDWENGAA